MKAAAIFSGHFIGRHKVWLYVIFIDDLVTDLEGRHEGQRAEDIRLLIAFGI